MIIFDLLTILLLEYFKSIKRKEDLSGTKLEINLSQKDFYT